MDNGINDSEKSAANFARGPTTSLRQPYPRSLGNAQKHRASEVKKFGDSK